MKNDFKVGIIGTGSWGLALAKVLTKNKGSLFYAKNFDESQKQGIKISSRN